MALEYKLGLINDAELERGITHKQEESYFVV